MKLSTSVLLALLLQFFPNAEAGEPGPYEIPRTQVLPIQDSNTQGQYELYIKLPENYSENSDETYPVIYTTDAIWHFEMLSGATEYLMPNTILVGISWQKNLDDDRPFISRFRDYTMVESTNPEHQAKYQFGQASTHLSFIRDDVIKYVETHYRAHPDRRAYFGYSVGGAFGAYILFTEPDTFRNYVLGSPAFSDRSIEFIDQIEAGTASDQKDRNASVYLSIGELEVSEMELTQRFVSMLQRRPQSGLAFNGLDVIEDSDHGTAFPETVLRSVRWLSRLNNE